MLEASNNSELPAIPGKRYFTIGEVSELCGVKPHVVTAKTAQHDFVESRSRDVAVAEHHTFGPPRRPSGVDDVCKRILVARAPRLDERFARVDQFVPVTPETVRGRLDHRFRHVDHIVAQHVPHFRA